MMLMDEDLEMMEPFLDEDFSLAAEFYSEALSRDPNNASLLANRSPANFKLEKFTEAVQDAMKAIELDPSLSKAYLRKGIACMELEEYETARVALKAGAALDPENSKFKELIEGCDKYIEEEMNASANASLSSSKQSAPSVPIENDSTQESADGHQEADAPESKPLNRTINLSRRFHHFMCACANCLDYTGSQDRFCRFSIFGHPRSENMEKRSSIDVFDLLSTRFSDLSEEDSMMEGNSLYQATRFKQ